MESNNGEAVKKLMKHKVTAIAVIVVSVIGCIALVLLLIKLTRDPEQTPVPASSAVSVASQTVSYDEAVAEAQGYIDSYMKSCIVTVSVGDCSVALNGFDANAPVDYDAVRSYITGLGGNEQVISVYRTVLSVSGEPERTLNTDYIAEQLRILSGMLDAGSDGSYEIVENTVRVTRGVEHVTFDSSYAEGVVSQAFLNGTYGPIVLVTHTHAAAEPDWDALYDEYYIAPVDASYAVDADGNTYIIESQMGRDLDISEIQQSYREESWSVQTFRGYSVAPDITTQNIDADMFQDVLGEMTTTYYVSAYSRTNNLELATESINGTIILPGYKFSFNNVVGERTVERGYMDALIYVGDGVEPGLGGGICQVSSTLYNAALRADLNQIQRSCHMYTVSYVELGMDATVSWGNLDYVFENSTAEPIKIEATAENGSLTIRILGTADYESRTITFRNQVTEVYPSDTITKTDETLEPGTRLVETSGRSGYKVETYRTVTLNGETLPEEWVCTSIYSPIDTVITEGPPAET